MSAQSAQSAERAKRVECFAEQLSADSGAEPLSLFTRRLETPAAFGDAHCEYFEYSSRGDRVPGRLLRPREASGPVPLILFQHGLNGSKDAVYLEAAAPWIQHGVAVASIDFPLHGERADAKLSQQLLASGASGADTARADAAALWIEFTRQAVCDLRRAVDVLSSFPELDGRVAYAAFSLGAMIGAVYCASDPRPCAAALALAGGGLGPPEIDPCTHVARIAPRPILFVNATRDERVSRTATEALYEQAKEPKRIAWFDAGHSDLPGAALKEMWLFLREQLSIPAS